jgi:hypothetical protein
LKIKISEILIENITIKSFLESCNQRKATSISLGILDEIQLKVPIMLKRKKTNIIVKSKLVIAENKNGISIGILSDFTKTLLFPLVIGILPSLLFLFLFSNLTVCIVFSIFISALIFTMYYLNTQKVADKYLNKIKDYFFKHQNFKV